MREEQFSVKLPPVEQIGIVVRDMDEAIAFYECTFGWGPFRITENSLKGCIYRGKPTDCKLKLAFYNSGTMEIEIIQVLEGESAHTEFLRDKGDWIHHLRFRVDNLDEVLKAWATKGINPIWQHDMPEYGISWAYMDTGAVGGVMVELYQTK